METTTRVHSPVSYGQCGPPMGRERRCVLAAMDENVDRVQTFLCVLSVWTQRKDLAAAPVLERRSGGRGRRRWRRTMFYSLSVPSFVGRDVSVPLAAA